MKTQSSNALNNIFSVNLNIKKTEKVLVFTDGYTNEIRKIAINVSEAGKKYTDHMIYKEYPSTECHGVEPPHEIWKEAFGKTIYMKLKENNYFTFLLKKKTTDKQNRNIERIIRSHKHEAVNAVIALSYFSTSHTKFRVYLNRICGARYASMPLFEEKMLKGAMSVNWKKMQKRTASIAKIINGCEEIEICTPNGTFLRFSKKNRKAQSDTGIITRKGTFSNLPAGEVYLAPLESTAHGKLVLEWAPTRKLKDAITLQVEKGMVKEIYGKEIYAADLKKKLSERKENTNIAELGIGTNNKAVRPDNILESEKILGTIHVALGDNSTFGGKVRTSFHQDFIFFKPTVTLIYKSGRKKILLKNGKLLGAVH